MACPTEDEPSKDLGMYEDENKLRLRENVVNAEENYRVVKEKERMEKDLRFF